MLTNCSYQLTCRHCQRRNAAHIQLLLIVPCTLHIHRRSSTASHRHWFPVIWFPLSNCYPKNTASDWWTSYRSRVCGFAKCSVSPKPIFISEIRDSAFVQKRNCKTRFLCMGHIITIQFKFLKLEPHGLGFIFFSHMFTPTNFWENWHQFCENWLSGFWLILLPLDGIRIDEQYKNEYNSRSAGPILMKLVSIPCFLVWAF